jgi:hypothetical protein
MIDDLDEALRQFLIRELPIKNGEVDIEFDQPRREWSARVSRPTLNLFLYDVRENQKLRQTQPMWQNEIEDGVMVQRRKPVRLDLYYMITAWATEPEDEHRLLSRALMTLFRFPNIPDELLPESLRVQGKHIPLMIAQYHEFQNPTDVWSVLDNEMRPALSFILTLTIDPHEPVSVSLVRARELRVGTSGHPERTRLDQPAEADRFWTIGGNLHSSEPIEYDQVHMTLVERGLQVAVQPDGRFTIGQLRTGTYTLEVAAGDSPARRYHIAVPAPDYTLEV